MNKTKSELPIFYETAHAEFASALEMLAACKETDSPNQAALITAILLTIIVILIISVVQVIVPFTYIAI